MLTKRDERNLPVYNVDYERLSNLVDKIFTLFFENTGAYMLLPVEENHLIFTSNQALLMTGCVLYSNFFSVI